MRLPGVDVLRFVAAFSVVTLHFEPYTALSKEVHESMCLAARYAVPFFFIASGFFLQPKSVATPEKLLNNIAHLVTVFFYASLVYIPWRLLRGSSLLELVDSNLLLNGTAYHLWFIPSLGFAILVTALCLHGNKKRILLPLSIFILILYICANYIPFASSSQLDFFRFLSSIPFFFIGTNIRKYYEILSVKKLGYPLVLFGIILQITEFYLCNLFGFEVTNIQMGFGICIFTIGLFLVATSFSELRSKILSMVSALGAKYATGIYIWHIWWVSLIKKIYEQFGVIDRTWSTMLMPFIVFLATLTMLIIWGIIVVPILIYLRDKRV